MRRSPDPYPSEGFNMRVPLVGGPQDGEQWSVALGPLPAAQINVAAEDGTVERYRFVEVTIAVSEGGRQIGQRFWRAYIYRGTRGHPYTDAGEVSL